MRLIGISLLLAFGVSYFTASEWLQKFAYRCNLGVGIFLISALLVGMAGVMTVIWNVHKAASRNPALGLRNE
jgi:hypothetical protein